jgi:hypothetical protein
MVNEVLNYGYVFSTPDVTEARTGAGASALIISSETFDPSNPSRRPTGWTHLRMLRTFAKEDVERSLGVSENTVLEGRSERIQKVMSCLKNVK